MWRLVTFLVLAKAAAELTCNAAESGPQSGAALVQVRSISAGQYPEPGDSPHYFDDGGPPDYPPGEAPTQTNSFSGWRSQSVAFVEGNLSYLGCYTDKPGRNLPSFRPFSGKPSACRRACFGFRYFGLQNGEDCYCGNQLLGNPLSSSECNMQCVAETSSSCGGAWRNSVHVGGVFVSSGVSGFSRVGPGPELFWLFANRFTVSVEPAPVLKKDRLHGAWMIEKVSGKTNVYWIMQISSVPGKFEYMVWDGRRDKPGGQPDQKVECPEEESYGINDPGIGSVYMSPADGNGHDGLEADGVGMIGQWIIKERTGTQGGSKTYSIQPELGGDDCFLSIGIGFPPSLTSFVPGAVAVRPRCVEEEMDVPDPFCIARSSWNISNLPT